jgi:hypothetical protein
MRFGLVLTRATVVSLLALGLVSCGTQDTPNLGTIEFAPVGIDLQLAANAGTVTFGAYARVTVRTPTGQPNSQATLRLAGTICTGFQDLTACVLNPLNPTGVPVELEVDGLGGLDLTIIYTLTGGSSGEFTIVEGWSGSAYNRLNVTVECVDAGAITCP